MLHFVVVSISFLVFLLTRPCISYTIEELKALNYEVDISQVPTKKDEEQIHPVVYMTSVFGQEYQCSLPMVAEDDTSEKLTYSERNTDIQDLLKPLHTGNCLLKAKDWWTYELCFGQYIKQFHIEDGQIIGQVLTLGLYDSDYDWNNETEEEKFKLVKQRYHSQYYVNGTKCDLTGHPRVAEVRIFCEEDSGDYIHRVDEPGTCSYVIAVHTSRVCSHPQLKPLPSKKAHTIPCHPLLSDEQYSTYMKKLNEEKALAEQERSQWLTTQQERLEELKNEFFLSATNIEDSDQDVEVDQINNENQNFLTVKKKFVLGAGSAEEINQDDELDKLTADEEPIALSKMSIENMLKIVKILENSINPKSNTLDSDVVENDSEDILVSLKQMYDEELEKQKKILSPEKLATIKAYSYAQFIQEYFNALLLEAENSETADEDKYVALQKFTSALNLLLKKLDKTEKDVIDAAKRLAEVKSGVSRTASDDTLSDEYLAEDTYLEKDKKKDSNPVAKQKILLEKEAKDGSIVDDKENDDFQVRIRRLDQIQSNGKTYEIDRIQQKKLELAIKEKLEKYGVNTEGRKIEVKIIKAGYFGSQLTDHEASQFENMITALLTGEQEAIQEMERNKKMEENYQFTWKDDIEEDEGE